MDMLRPFLSYPLNFMSYSRDGTVRNPADGRAARASGSPSFRNLVRTGPRRSKAEANRWLVGRHASAHYGALSPQVAGGAACHAMSIYGHFCSGSCVRMGSCSTVLR